jgi:hypothetical protein
MVIRDTAGRSKKPSKNRFNVPNSGMIIKGADERVAMYR